MTTYITKTLMPNEELIFSSKPHMAIFFQPGWWFILGLTLLFFNFNFLGPIVLFIGLLQEILMLVYYISSEYAITDQRVLMKVGIIQRKSLEMFLSKVEGIYVDQSIFGRIFNFGKIIINGIGGNKNIFNYIPDPLQFRRLVQEQVSSLRHFGT
jgi:uncharacterized membrane protein YdbT with pleckstrin-like domain